MTTVAFLGDSITGSNGYADGYPKALAGLMGWTTSPGLVWGWGGMGYCDPGNEPETYPGPFQNRVQSDIIDNVPDVVLVAGGLNDPPDWTAEQIGTAAGLLFDTIRAGLPGAWLIVVSPYYPSGTIPASITDANAAIAAEAASRGLLYIDTLTSPWITGTGYVGNEQGDGNADIYTSADGTHPTAAGSAYYATTLADALGTQRRISGLLTDDGLYLAVS